MMISRGLFGWSSPHIQPLTPVSEVSEPPESPLPEFNNIPETLQIEDEGLIDYNEETEPPPAAVPFMRLFAYADALDMLLMAVGSLAAAAHGAALVVYLHFFGKIIDLLGSEGLANEHLSRELTKVLILFMFLNFFILASEILKIRSEGVASLRIPSPALGFVPITLIFKSEAILTICP